MNPPYPYLIYLHYFATGEGMTDALIIDYADNPAAAKEKFLDWFCDKPGWEGQTEEDYQRQRAFWGQGVDVHPLAEPAEKATALLAHFFVPGVVEHVLRAARAGALMDFQFKWYANYS